MPAHLYFLDMMSLSGDEKKYQCKRFPKLKGMIFCGPLLIGSGARVQVGTDSTAVENQFRAPIPSSLAGAWVLELIETINPDGQRTQLCNAIPHGLFIVDAHGNYSLEMVLAPRLVKYLGARRTGIHKSSPSISFETFAHFGKLRTSGTRMRMCITNASVRAWEKNDLVSPYSISGDRLTFTTHFRPTGTMQGVRVDAVWTRHTSEVLPGNTPCCELTIAKA